MSEGIASARPYVVKSFVGDAKNLFLAKHAVKISEIVTTMFYPESLIPAEKRQTFKQDRLERMFQGTLFACLIETGTDDNLIGICSCSETVFYTQAASDISRTDAIPDFVESSRISRKIALYDSLRYMKIESLKILNCFFSDSENQAFKSMNGIYIYDKIRGVAFNMQPVSMPVDIQNLCKDKNYKDVGRTMIQKIGEHYKSLGIDTIYLSAESTNHRDTLTNALTQMLQDKQTPENILTTAAEDALVLYQSDQISLCNYYEKIGFTLLSDVYDISSIITNGNVSTVTFYRTYKLDLT